MKRAFWAFALLLIASPAEAATHRAGDTPQVDWRLPAANSGG